MSKKKLRLRRYIIVLVLIFIVLYLIQKYNKIIDISVLEYGEIEETVSTKGFIIKDEVIVDAKCFGSVTYYYNEGEKINKSGYLADISTTNSTEQINQEIKNIEEAINSPESIITIGNGQESKYSKYTKEELAALKKTYEDALVRGKVPIFSPKSGIVTYNFDGLESHFDFDKVLELMPSDLENLEEIKTNTYDLSDVNGQEPIMKVINNFEFYIACIISNNDVSTYKEGSYIRVRFNDDAKLVFGYVEKINIGTEESVIILRFDDYFYKVFNQRIAEVDLINNIRQGIKVDKNAIIEKDGLTGVYIKDISNIIKFLPIEIIGSDKKYCVVSQGEILGEGERGIININDKIYNTVKAFDKVVLDTDKVYEGQIVD